MDHAYHFLIFRMQCQRASNCNILSSVPCPLVTQIPPATLRGCVRLQPQFTTEGHLTPGSGGASTHNSW